jgi:hypothetical protein
MEIRYVCYLPRKCTCIHRRFVEDAGALRARDETVSAHFALRTIGWICTSHDLVRFALRTIWLDSTSERYTAASSSSYTCRLRLAPMDVVWMWRACSVDVAQMWRGCGVDAAWMWRGCGSAWLPA